MLVNYKRSRGSSDTRTMCSDSIGFWRPAISESPTLPGNLRLDLAEGVKLHATVGDLSVHLTREQLEAIAGVLCNQNLGPARTLRDLFTRGVLDLRRDTPPTRESLISLLPNGERVYLDPRVDLDLTFGMNGRELSLGASKLYVLFIEAGVGDALAEMSARLQSAGREMLMAALARGRQYRPDDVLNVWREICTDFCSRAPLRDYLRVKHGADGRFELERIRPIQQPTCPYPLLSIGFSQLGSEKPAPARRVTLPTASLPDVATLLRKLARGSPGDALVEFALTRADPDSLRRVLAALAVRNGLATTPPPSLNWKERMPPAAPLSILHLGHATLLARGGDSFVAIDPWLLASNPDHASQPFSTAQLPPLEAILLTHEHWDHVNMQSLLRYPDNVPIIVPKQVPLSSTAVYPRYVEFLSLFGLHRVIELAHWETHVLGDGLAVTAVPFMGEGAGDEGCVRNCYLIERQGARALIHSDSGPDSRERSDVSEGVIERLVQEHGAIGAIYATRGQDLSFGFERSHELMPVLLGHDLMRLAGVVEHGNCPASYLAALCAKARCAMLVLYAEGGAEWYPEKTTFLRRGDADTRFLPYEYLRDTLDDIALATGVPVHLSRPLDLVRCDPAGIVYEHGPLAPRAGEPATRG